MSDPPEPRIARLVRIRGRVQGVWYRGWTIEVAQSRGIDGWVRNRRDGTVEALFCGPPKQVDAMILACQTGPPAADVMGVEVSEAEDPGLIGFRQRQTT